MQNIELSLAAAFLLRLNIITAPAGLVNIITKPARYRPAGAVMILACGCRHAGLVMIFTRPAGAVMIFTRSRNAAASDNSMYCMIPDPFPSSAFGKGSATPDYSLICLWSKKKFESYFRDRLTFSNVDSGLVVEFID